MKILKHILIIMVTAAISGNLFCQVCQVIPDRPYVTEAPAEDKILNKHKDTLEIEFKIFDASSIIEDYVNENIMDIENWMIDLDSWEVIKSGFVKEILFDEDNECKINLEEWMLNAFTS